MPHILPYLAFLDVPIFPRRIGPFSKVWKRSQFRHFRKIVVYYDVFFLSFSEHNTIVYLCWYPLWRTFDRKNWKSLEPPGQFAHGINRLDYNLLVSNISLSSDWSNINRFRCWIIHTEYLFDFDWFKPHQVRYIFFIKVRPVHFWNFEIWLRNAISVISTSRFQVLLSDL